MTKALVGNPMTSLDISFGPIEPALGIGLGAESLLGGLPGPVRSREAGLVPARGELAHHAKTSPRHQATPPLGDQENSSGSTVPDATKASRADIGMRTCRPTWTNLIRRSATSRLGNLTVVPSSLAASSTVNNLSTELPAFPLPCLLYTS